MKKTLKMAISGAFALVLMFGGSASAFAEGYLNMYHNIQGGPTQSSTTCWVYRNTGNSYYAQCTSILNSTATVKGTNNTPNKSLYFSSEKRIDFLSTSNEERLYFEGTMNTTNISNYSKAYITIGA